MIDVFYYCAMNNRSGSSQIVSDFGLRPENSPKELARQLAYCTTKDKAATLKKLAEIHPDKDLFEEKHKTIVQELESKFKEEKTQFSNMNGQIIKSEVDSLKNNLALDSGRSKHEILMVGGIIILGLAIIMKS